MGCNRSLPFTPVASKNSQDRQVIRPIPLNFISSRAGPISNFYEIQIALGPSDQCTMYYAREKESSLHYTIKEVPKTQASQLDSEVIQKEVTILSQLDHPNILKVFETIDSARSYYIVYEHISGGSLRERVKKCGDEALVAKFIYDVILGLNYMHKQGFVHCDVNPNNIMISNQTEESIAKIVGFAFARKFDEGINGLEFIDPTYTSPELLTAGQLSPHCDLWSVGIMLYSLLVGKLPFYCRNIDGILNEISSCRLDFVNPNFTCLSMAARDLISKLLERNPNTRITAEQALSHIWLQQSQTNYIINYNTLHKLKNFQVRSNLVRCLLSFYIFKINLEENDIVKCFKQIDQNFDGKVSREELIYTFGQAGIGIEQDIDCIMENIDIDRSGLVDYSELKIVLTDWTKEMKKKNIAKLFNAEGGFVNIKNLMNELEYVLPSEWKDFILKVKPENNLVSLAALKSFVKANLE